MAHILKNQHLEIQMDLPLESYHFSRFDWTGKIVSVKYKNIYIIGFEKLNEPENTTSGKGLYNEFGIDAALGFAETKVGDWFHKIGIGLLKKDSDGYLHSRTYTIQPATFTFSDTPEAIIMTCVSPAYNGYAYVLKKEIRLMESGFVLTYFLKNTGEKTIQTDEYNHNFLAIDTELIGKDYLLKFPFYLQPNRFAETVNREGKVKIGEKEFTFIGTPTEPFFFSNLSRQQKRRCLLRIDQYQNQDKNQ